MTQPQVVSARGRVYDGVMLRRVVLERIRKRLGRLLPPDWIARVDAAMTPEFIRFRNGCVPSAMARDLEDYALGLKDPVPASQGTQA